MEDEEHDGGGEYEEHDGGEYEEQLSEDGGLEGMPLDLDPSLVWEPPEEDGYVAKEERLEPRATKQYKRGYTQLPNLQDWPLGDVVLVPYGKRYMLILAFHYRNFIIIEFLITYILILHFIVQVVHVWRTDEEAGTCLLEHPWRPT